MNKHFISILKQTIICQAVHFTYSKPSKRLKLIETGLLLLRIILFVVGIDVRFHIEA